MKITDATYVVSSPSVDLCPVNDQPEFAFIGRSNVGKSSLINMLTGKKNLARISATPGKTQLINHYLVKSVVVSNRSAGKTITWHLVDLPGYGFAVVSQKKRRTWEQMIEGYIRKRESLVNLFVLIDSRHDPQKNDLDFMNQLGEWQIPFCIVFTKSDKNKPGATQRNVNAFLNRLSETWAELPMFFVTSAAKDQGKEELLDFIQDILRKA